MAAITVFDSLIHDMNHYKQMNRGAYFLMEETVKERNEEFFQTKCIFGRDEHCFRECDAFKGAQGGIDRPNDAGRVRVCVWIKSPVCRCWGALK